MALRGTFRLLFCANCRLFGSTCPNFMKQSASDSSNLLLTSPKLLWVVKTLMKKKKARNLEEKCKFLLKKCFIFLKCNSDQLEQNAQPSF